MLTAVLLSALALGLPFAVAVFPLHALRYWRAAWQGKPQAQGLAAVPYGDQGLLHNQCCALVSGRLQADVGQLGCLRIFQLSHQLPMWPAA
jgi:hypothetical protein